jgi:hypothetical protein
VLKREFRRKTKRIYTILLVIIGLAGLFLLLFVAYQSISSVLKVELAGQDRIIKPLGSTTTIDEIRIKLDDKNIIVDDLTESSASGTIVGKIKGGPDVFFTENQDASWQVNSLVLIMSRITADNKKPKVIDLRNIKPIVKF